MSDFSKNRLIGYISMEADVQDGKLFRERERVIYARLGDMSVLGKAESADHQEQWTIKLPKTENNSAKGQIRVRKVIPMVKSTDGEKFELSHRDGDDAQYVLTTKAEKAADDRLEVPAPVTKDMFELFRLLAENGMIKDRYHFPIENGLVFEVDVYLKEDGSYHEWVKIDLELKDISVDIPELPFSVEEMILDKTQDSAEKSKITDLYETVFLTKNNSQEARKLGISQEGLRDIAYLGVNVAEEGFFDRLIVHAKDFLKGGKNIDKQAAHYHENREALEKLVAQLREVEKFRSDDVPEIKPGEYILGALTREGNTCKNAAELVKELTAYKNIAGLYAKNYLSNMNGDVDKVVNILRLVNTDLPKAYAEFLKFFKNTTPAGLQSTMTLKNVKLYNNPKSTWAQGTPDLLGEWRLATQNLLTTWRGAEQKKIGELLTSDYMVQSKLKISTSVFKSMTKEEMVKIISLASEINNTIEPLTLIKTMRPIENTIYTAINRMVDGLERDFYRQGNNSDMIDDIVFFVKSYVDSMVTRHLITCGNFYRTVKAVTRLADLNLNRLK